MATQMVDLERRAVDGEITPAAIFKKANHPVTLKVRVDLLCFYFIFRFNHCMHDGFFYFSLYYFFDFYH